MGLADVVDAVERREKTLTVFNPDPASDVVDGLAEQFAELNLVIRGETTPTGRPADFAVLEVDGRVLEAVDLDDLREFVDAVPSGPGDLGAAEGHERAVLEHLSEATFASRDETRMLAATREIEDRALRVGEGTLRTGFQTATNLRRRRDRYEDLAASDLDVHIYAAPGEEAPPIDGASIHLVDDVDVHDHWFVFFDGGTDERQCSALLGAECAPGSFCGFWTYDPEVVEWGLSRLRVRGERCAP